MNRTRAQQPIIENNVELPEKVPTKVVTLSTISDNVEIKVPQVAPSGIYKNKDIVSGISIQIGSKTRVSVMFY